MKIIKQIAHQGDVQIYSITNIPKEAKLIKKQFIATSEQSGSFHALFGKYDQYVVEDGFVLDVKEDCILNHSLQKNLANKSMDIPIELLKKDHRHTIVKKGLYFVGIQQRFDPLSGIKKKVRD